MSEPTREPAPPRLYTFCQLHAPHEHETLDEACQRYRWLIQLREARKPRDITRAEYARLVPPLAPRGCAQNIARGKVNRELIRLQVTVEGKRIPASYRERFGEPRAE